MSLVLAQPEQSIFPFPVGHFFSLRKNFNFFLLSSLFSIPPALCSMFGFFFFFFYPSLGVRNSESSALKNHRSLYITPPCILIGFFKLSLPIPPKPGRWIFQLPVVTLPLLPLHWPLLNACCCKFQFFYPVVVKILPRPVLTRGQYKKSYIHLPSFQPGLFSGPRLHSYAPF